MTSTYADPAYIVTLEVKRDQADRMAEELAVQWNMAPVQFERPSHGRVWLEFYFPSDVAARLAREIMAEVPGVFAAVCHRSEARAWEAAFRASFHRRDVGRRLRICPVWEQVEAPSDGRATVLIDPGLSFGTGEHFTTAFCLEMMDELWLKSRPSSFLDVGSGSGILAVAAARLGCERIVALEHDEEVLPYLEDNLRMNEVAPWVEVLRMDITAASPSGTFQIVCANLYGGLLMTCAPRLAGLAERRLVLSGLREFELEGVSEVYRALGARELCRDGDGEWGGLVLAID